MTAAPMANLTFLGRIADKAIRYGNFRLLRARIKRERRKQIERAFERAEELSKCRTPVARSALLLPTASPGNLGDDAVFRATVLELLRAGFSIVTLISFDEEQKYDIPGANVVVLPVHHDPEGTRYIEFAEVVAKYSHFFIWGADIVDGTHGIEVVKPRQIMANLAAHMGVKSTLCSFSVAPTRSDEAMALLRKLDKRVVLQCRDPISAERLRSELPHHDIEVTADLAFMLQANHNAPIASAARAWAEQRHANGKVLMGVNVNDLLCSYFGISKDDLLLYFARTLSDLYASNPKLAYIHIPHDTHANKAIGNITDFSLARELNSLLPESIRAETFVPAEELSAPEVRAICTYVDLVFSSRMHLAIASLAVGTPAYAVAYQGKFEGLFAHFGLKNMFITPQQLSDRKQAFDFLQGALRRRGAVREQIQRHLPRIKELAARNIGEHQSSGLSTPVIEEARK